MCILIQYCIVLIIVAFNEIWDVSSNFVLFQNHFVYSGSLAFHMTFRVIFSISVNQAAGIFIVIALNLYANLRNVGILTVLSFQSKQHGMSFHLFWFLVSFSDTVCISMYKSWPLWLKIFFLIILLFLMLLQLFTSFHFWIIENV